MSTTLAQRLRVLRGDVPQAEFAARVGIHKSSWGRYERGVGEPTGSDLARLCSVCEVEPLWLLCGEGDMRATARPPVRKGPVGILQTFPTARAAAPEGAGDAPASSTGTNAPEQGFCRQCRWLEARLEQLDRERRELLLENRQLWRENSELRERLARLEERSQGREPAGMAGEAV